MNALLLNRIKEYAAQTVLYFVAVWVVLALCFQLFMVGLELTGKDELTHSIVNWFDWKFNGQFKNMPGNIWYEEPKAVAIGTISNKVQIGSLAGNRNLEFGVKNVLEEVIQDKGYDIDHAAKEMIEIDIVYLDVLKTQSSLSVFHKDKESVVIRLQGKLYKEGEKKPYKKLLVEESADEISMSTLAIDQGGKFNQTNLSSALKKATVSLVNKLLD